MCVGWGVPGIQQMPWGGPLHPHPGLVGFSEGLSGIGRSAAGQAGRRWGGPPARASWGGRGIWSCPPRDGSDMSPELRADRLRVQRARRLGGAASGLTVSLSPDPGPPPTPCPHRYPGLREEARDAVSARRLLHGGHREHVRWLRPGRLRQRHCGHAQLPAWGAR